MRKLTIQEKKRLNTIIAANRLVRSDDPERRRAFLREIEVLEFCEGLDLKLPTSDFVPLLRSHLASLNPSKERLFVQNFLEYEERLSPDDSDFIHKLIETEPVVSNPIQKSHDPAGRRKADNTILVKFDLTDMVGAFQKQLDPETGPFAFSFTVPERQFGERFIVARLLLEFAERRKHRECFEAAAATLCEEDAINPGYLLDRLRGELGSVRGWLEDKTRDLMFCVWNHDRPEAQMAKIASNFWQHVLDHYRPILTSRNQRLLVLWANVGTREQISINMDRFFLLERPQNFDPEQVEAYWQSELEVFKMDDSILSGHLRCLQNKNGHLITTFHEMRAILKSINGGSSSHAY